MREVMLEANGKFAFYLRDGLLIPVKEDSADLIQYGTGSHTMTYKLNNPARLLYFQIRVL